MTPHATFEERTAGAVRTLTVCVVILGVFLMGAIGLAIYGFTTANTASAAAARLARVEAADARRLAGSAEGTASSAKQIAAAVSEARRVTILHVCQTQNGEHTSTIKELDAILGPITAHATAAERAQLVTSRRFTVLLIDRLAPLQNCKQLVAQETSPHAG